MNSGKRGTEDSWWSPTGVTTFEHITCKHEVNCVKHCRLISAQADGRICLRQRLITMSHRLLITGGSGYLGGTLLARLPQADLPAYDKIFALVRTDAQADAVSQYADVTPLRFDIKDEEATREAIVSNNITIVFFLIDASSATSQGYLIKALAEVKTNTNMDVHLLHTSGAKIFSSHTGAPTDRPLLDDEADLYKTQKAQRAPITAAQPAVDANNEVIELAEKLGVYAYVFVPCIVYGKGEGFGNPISIQTVAIIRAARSAHRVYDVNSGRPTWPVCHVIDNSNLYIKLLRALLKGGSSNAPPNGKQGYYLAASGSVAWADLYAAIARALARRDIIEDDTVKPATDDAIGMMAAGLGCPKELVPLQLGGL